MKDLKKFLNNLKLNINNNNKFIIIKYNKLIYYLCLSLLNKNYILNLFFIFKNGYIYLTVILNVTKKIKKIIFYKNKNYCKKKNNYSINYYLTNSGIMSEDLIKLFKISGKLFLTII